MMGLCKSLISSRGLQSAWQKVSRRLQVTERGLSQAQKDLARLPEEHVRRDVFHDLVEVRQHQQLAEHSEAIAKLQESVAQSETLLRDVLPQVRQCQERILVLEELPRFQEEVARIQQKQEEQHQEVLALMEEASV